MHFYMDTACKEI